jgi:hypothetical protein
VNQCVLRLYPCAELTCKQLRHTYLRVLHPLLTKTQLRDIPYKRAQVVVSLESLMENSQIRDIDPTTKRLVERCLSGEWCDQYRKPRAVKTEVRRDAEGGKDRSDSVASTAQTAPVPSTSKSSQLERQGSGRMKTLKLSKSVENLKGKSKPPRPPRSGLTSLRRPSTDSASSLPGVAAATTPVSKRRQPSRSGELQGSFAAQQAERHHQNRSADSLHPHPTLAQTGMDGLVSQPHSPSSHNSLPATPSAVSLNINPKSGTTPRRSAPPAPARRRKPPAVPQPAERTNSGATITAIASSNSAPTAKVTKSSGLQHSLS